MKCLRMISIVFCFALIGCSKSLEYQMVFTSAQSRTVYISYPDGFWGDLESLRITHKEKTDVAFQPKLIDVGGETRKCIQLHVPHPNQNELEWSDDKLSAEGHSTLWFKSRQQDFTLRFDYSLHFSENKEVLGGSSMYVSAVSFEGRKIEREVHPFNEIFIFEITELIN